LMFYMEDMNETEISKALSIPKGTVKSRLNKARKLLKEMYLNG
ncbi:MAG: RNA polymerase subunit sigma-70, partial [Lachnospiraceae bacterium]|nr:RNA polymerase subunit sigma-70 [Lachnospiraceae bacterium]